MDDQEYYRLLNSCIDHFLGVLGPRLDQWAQGKAERWRLGTSDEDTIREEGRPHWQVRD